ncbi:hypothetical protein FACS1894123_03960 [Bacteroidia bacterium]|nr:hypothetical protein FACS1894123_03960 [Bacteroidia bacterium]
MKKINLWELKKVLTNNEMRKVVGGYDGNGTYGDPYQLPEVIVCAGCTSSGNICCVSDGNTSLFKYNLH